METWKCHKCDRFFSRRWNLQRHLNTVHTVVGEDRRQQRRNSVFQHSDLPLNRDSNYENNENNNNRYAMNHDKTYYHYDNFNNRLPKSNYYNYEPTPPYFIEPEKEEKKRLTPDDKLRIQKTLKNLENFLKQFFPSDYVFRIIAGLYDLCISLQSDRPLKRILIQNFIGHLWES